MSENFSKAALVMIEALLAFIVDTSNIYHDGASVEDSRISGTLEIYQSYMNKLPSTRKDE